MKNIAIAALLGAMLVPFAASAVDDMGSKPSLSSKARTEVKDSVITTKIKALYVKDKLVSALHVKIVTDDHGVVMLSGKAKSQAEIDRAIEIARGVEGVTSVKSEIIIGS